MIPIRDINPTQRFSIITTLLIVVNIAVYVYEMLLGPRAEFFVQAFALVPRELFSPQLNAAGSIPAWATVITSMFLHGGIFHVGGNMLYLWIFGNNIEDAMGRFRFVLFYALCGSIAAYSHAVLNATSAVPMIGASGAVSGVLGAYLMLYPRARVMTLVVFGFYIRTMAVPAMFVLGFWFILQFLNAALSPGTGAGIAWHAHIGGFIAGVTLIGLFKRRNVPFGGRRSDG
ncbi:MAG: rhomboid family intramembrane serine protease [Nitrospirae bacterium GWD2_57_9]|nr:MAG: rhomboid family intramembrane serine protease [Nitrospirae bacterium GWD2_57_9]OGW49514.1 MAG: rhomboid family intramembrane serine protease [Nitrospirae bacterium GWC2_57_9]